MLVVLPDGSQSKIPRYYVDWLAKEKPDEWLRYVTGIRQTIIDERKNMETALITARNKAEEANKLKSAFLANMNHEIRTPLNSMSGYAQVLLNYDISEEERRKCLRRIIDNSESLAQLLNTMMELSSTEAGKNALRKEPIDVNLLFRNIVEKFININKNSNIQILSYLPNIVTGKQIGRAHV